MLELLATVPFLCAVPPLFHQLANSTLLHAAAPSAVNVQLGATEILPAMAILPFMLYQLVGFGTLHYLVSKPVNWMLNLTILVLIITAYVANRMNAFAEERMLVATLVVIMAVTVAYGVLKLKKMQAAYDANAPRSCRNTRTPDAARCRRVMAAAARGSGWYWLCSCRQWSVCRKH